MAPKSPDELRRQIERKNESLAKPGHEKTAEGKEVPTPSRRDFFGNLEKLGQPDKREDNDA
jgi:hypothetical protein